LKREAIIPARGGSKRLPRKNVVELGGRPMIAHVVGTAMATELFERVVVSTEDSEISAVAREAGATVHQRPSDLATDRATVVQVCSDWLTSLSDPPARFCCLYATAAFLTSSDLIEAERLLDEVDAVMGVSRYPIHPYKALETSEAGFLRPKWPQQNAKKSQEFPHLVASNGTFYWAGTDSFIRNPTFYPHRLKGFELPPERAVDIDTPADLEWARHLYGLQQRHWHKRNSPNEYGWNQ